MIKISIFYPHHKEGHFDMDYYVNTHMPLSIQLLSAHAGFRGVSVERGLGGGAPQTEPTYVAMCHYLFDSVEAFMAAFNAHRYVLEADMPHYTDIEAMIQISDVVMAQ